MNALARAPEVARPSIRAAARSDRGRRANNEDALVIDLDHRLFVVADGMGGYEGGEVASRLTVHTVHDFFVVESMDADRTWPFGMDPDRSFTENQLVCAIRLANLEVMRRRRGRLARMGSTIVAVAIEGPRAIVAHVGDSRIYRLRDGALTRLTRDHSFIEQLRAMGVREEPEGMGHIITKAIGFAEDTMPDVAVRSVRPGDVLLLCSDGVTEPLDDEAIAKHLAIDDPGRAAESLVRAAYDAGGSDNITALVIRVE